MIYDLLVFTQYPLAYAPTRLRHEAKNMGLRFKICEYAKIKNIKKLPRAKSIILREPNISHKLYALRDAVLKHYLSTNTYVLNSNSYLKWSVLNKKTQEIEFEKAKIPHIESLEINPSTGRLKYPFIAKASLGSHGDHVYKIESDADLSFVLTMHKIEDLLFQEFQTSGFDLRVIVLDGSILGMMMRTPKKGNFLSNFSQGGSVSQYAGKDILKIKNIALNTARHFKLDYVGVDLMKSNEGKWKVLEVNRACQFQGFEKAIQVNVAHELVNWCILQDIQ
jgi:RimK family alpha-L-glutamate ligase